MSQGATAYGMYGIGIADPHWPAARWVAFLGPPLWVPGLLPLISVLPAIYPDGRLPGPRWRLPVAAAALGVGLFTIVMSSGYNDVAPGPRPFEIDIALPLRVAFTLVLAVTLLGGTVAIWVMSAVRLANAKPPERQQLAWLLLIVIPILVLGTMVLRLPLASAAVPVAIAVGVLRYRLFGIDIVLRRGLVYAALTATVIGVYLVATAVAGARLDHGPLPGVVAAALVAVGLTPLRERLQRGVDRLVYGDRIDPMRAVSRFGDTVQAVGEQEDLLPTVLTTVMIAVRAPGASVLSPDGRVLAVRGTDADGIALPLRVSGRDVGRLRVTERHPGERFTDGDLRLLAALAPQVAVVVRALDLAEALESERDRVVAATRAERDRLRRDLHDGLGPSLSGVGLGLQALESALVVGDQPTVSELLGRVRAETGTAVMEVRRILEDLRPTALDGADLASALSRHAEVVSSGVPIIVDMVTPLPALPAIVETAAYRIAQEALTNVVKHAGARQARLGLATDDHSLRVEVSDDGHGFTPSRSAGVGLASMQYGAESLGGSLAVKTSSTGTTIVALLPLIARP